MPRVTRPEWLDRWLNQYYWSHPGSRKVEMAAYILQLESDLREARGAIKRVLPMVEACKYETFSDLSGNEDTRTAAFRHAIKVLTSTAEAEGKNVVAGDAVESAAAVPCCMLCGRCSMHCPEPFNSNPPTSYLHQCPDCNRDE